MADKRVTAIRDDEKIGRNTCSVATECYSDADLIEKLDCFDIETPEAAVKHFRLVQDIFNEEEENARIEGGF